MNLRELRYQINFQYIKNIRRYLYEIEQNILEILPSAKVQPIQQLPDNQDPISDRLFLRAEVDESTFLIRISQVSITLSIVFNQKDGLCESFFSKKTKKLHNLGESIKVTASNVMAEFELSHEVFTAVFGEVYNEIVELEKFIKFNSKTDEMAESKVEEFEDIFYIFKEKTVRKIFDFKDNDELYPRANQSKFIGWQATQIFQISSRLAYNNATKIEENLKLSQVDIERYYKNEKQL